MDYSAKIDIKKLNKAFVTQIQGKTAKVECICIPTSEFYKGKADAQGHEPLYLSLEIKERKQASSYGETHFLKQQLEKESYKALTEEQRKNIPIIGGFSPSKFGNVQTVVAEEVHSQQSPNTGSINPNAGLPF